jgi:hypothetical protein
MNIKITKTQENQVLSVCGGEYAITDVEVFVDDRLDPRSQRERVLHAVVECYCAFLCHDKVEELTDLLLDGLDVLDE